MSESLFSMFGVFGLNHLLLQETCEDSSRAFRTQYNPNKEDLIEIHSRQFGSPVEYCIIETPTGQKMHFSRTSDVNTPDKLR